MHTLSIFHLPDSPPINLHARPHVVAFAGSRNGAVSDRTATAIVEGFRLRGYGFLTGCASGIDACFRSAFIDNSEVAERSIVACAFEDREKRFSTGEVFATTVVPSGLSPAAALHRRTIWIVKHSSVLVLFPENSVTGRWGRGSQLAFDAARHHLKPVFIVTASPPKSSVGETVVASNLFGVVDGYWVVPEGGVDEQ